MSLSRASRPGSRFARVGVSKATGATYTPPGLAAYVAFELVSAAAHLLDRPRLSILDPALGDGVLAAALLAALESRTRAAIHVIGYETDEEVAGRALRGLRARFPDAAIDVVTGDFLSRKREAPTGIDLVIANPPYVRAQILGARGARALARRFGLEGRVDLYQAFLLALVRTLGAGGVLAAIVSNRFMTTRGAGALRAALRSELDLHRVWDLGDTRLFDASVLPAVILGQRRRASPSGAAPAEPRFTTVYEIRSRERAAVGERPSIVEGLDDEGIISLPDGRRFEVRQGALAGEGAGVFRLSRPDVDDWLATVAARTWRTLGALGKIRVGVKTTADQVFIRERWDQDGEPPELLRPLLTHEVAGRYRALPPVKQILYPHLVVDGARAAADLAGHPRAARYLALHREALGARRYVIDAGRAWYELWVPHDPALWERPKLVFRDIAERATFWLDRSGAVVNGDCYWMACHDPADDPHLWLGLAVSNTTFMEAFYDRRFNNKLYAGRRRFMTQYVEHFPLPDPKGDEARRIVDLARERFEAAEEARCRALEEEIDRLVWGAFGVSG